MNFKLASRVCTTLSVISAMGALRYFLHAAESGDALGKNLAISINLASAAIVTGFPAALMTRLPIQDEDAPYVFAAGGLTGVGILGVISWGCYFAGLTIDLTDLKEIWFTQTWWIAATCLLGGILTVRELKQRLQRRANATNGAR